VPVTSWVRAPCVGSLADPGGAASGARALKGSGEAGFTPEAKGIGRDGTCARGRGDRARRCLRPRP